jgi:hypothetical protein
VAGKQNNRALKIHIAMIILVIVPKHNFDSLKSTSEFVAVEKLRCAKCLTDNISVSKCVIPCSRWCSPHPHPYCMLRTSITAYRRNVSRVLIRAMAASNLQGCGIISMENDLFQVGSKGWSPNHRE